MSLDVGCGSGNLLHLISEKTSIESKLIGTYSFEKAHQEAQKSFPEIDFRLHKFVDRLDFPDAAFDALFSVDALECIPNKIAFVKEAARVLKPGGQIIIAHWDWGTQVYHSNKKDLIRKFTFAFADWQQAWMDASDGLMGRKLWSIFEGSGLYSGKMHTFTVLETEFRDPGIGFLRMKDMRPLIGSSGITEDDYEEISKEMEVLHQAGKYFYSLNSYIYSGIKKDKK